MTVDESHLALRSDSHTPTLDRISLIRDNILMFCFCSTMYVSLDVDLQFHHRKVL